MPKPPVMIELMPPTEKDQLQFNQTQWDRFLTSIVGGKNLNDCLPILNIGRVQFKALMAKDAKRKIAYEEARIERLKSYFGDHELEMICSEIAAGNTVNKAIKKFAWEEDPRADVSKENAFYALVLKDPETREMYDEARMIQAEKMVLDDLLEIADDDSNDETWDGKPNSARVNRDRLRSDNRKWIASRLHYKRFGDKIQQDVNANVVVDHAARLEEARKRAEKAQTLRKQLTQEK